MDYRSAIKRRVMELVRPAIRKLRPPPLSHLRPVSRRWGWERGTIVDRYLIERFLETFQADITGTVLEIKNRRYCDRFGHDLQAVDVLDIDASNPNANIIADLAAADGVPSERYDCFILTETLQFIFDVSSAIRHAHRILKPGGVLLVSVPTTACADHDLIHTEYWRFTALCCRRLFGDIFGEAHVQVEPYGNFATCLAALSGIAIEELPAEELHRLDEKYTQGIFVRARKGMG